MDITLEQFKEALKLVRDFREQEYNKVDSIIKQVNKDLEDAFRRRKIGSIPVLIWLHIYFNNSTGLIDYELDSNMEEDFDYRWWDIITPILSKYKITNYRKGNKYM